MRESVTYQAIVEEGKIEARQVVLLRLGERRFGPPGPDARAALNCISDLNRLDRLIDQLLDASNWDELLATP